MSQFPNQRKVQKSAKSINEAIEAALAELNASRAEVDIKVIAEGSKGFLGIGAKDAVVEVTVIPQEVEEPAPAAVTAEQPAKPRQPRRRQNNRRRDNRASKAAKPQAEPVKAENKNDTVKEFVPTTLPIPAKEDDPVTAAKTFLTSLFAAMNIEVAAEVSLDGDMMTINLAGDNMGIIIGKRGDTLDSIQYLTSLVVNRRTEDYIKVTIDTENYREKRSDALIALSNRLAEKVARTGRKFTLEPMNPYERRIIHANLQDNEDVSTFSVGSEPYRKVVIAPKHPKRYDNKRGGYGRKPAPKREQTSAPKAEKTGSYTTTYKADFKPTPHKAEYHSYEEYLAAQRGEVIPPVPTTEDE